MHIVSNNYITCENKVLSAEKSIDGVIPSRHERPQEFS